MWIDIDDLLTPTVGIPEHFRPVKEEEAPPASLLFNDDKDKPGDGLALIHKSLKSSTQLSESDEKKYFSRLGDVVQQLVWVLFHDPPSRQLLSAYLLSIASGKTPLDQGLPTIDHRLLMTDIKHLGDVFGNADIIAEQARRLNSVKPDRVDDLLATEFEHIDWPHPLILAIAQLPFAIDQAGQCSAYLKAFSSYLAVIDGVGAIQSEDTELRERLLVLVKQYYQCRNYLVHHNLRLVYHVAKKHSHSANEIPDIFQEGVFGLVRAIEKYRHQSGYRFSTYAYNWIDAKARLAPVRHKGFMRLPTSAIADLTVLRRTATDLQSQGVLVNPVTVAARSDLSESRVKTLLALNNFSLSIDQPLLDREQGMTLSGVIADENQEVMQDVWEYQLKTVVDQLLTTLTDREAFILIHRFGLKGVPSQSLEIISSNVGLSRERVRQIEKKILAELRTLVETQRGDLKESLNASLRSTQN
ncbi:sigma-70 family RNA polymerase sigma factor [Oceanicoccus sagamiensis]|uniref:RNA polymerase sigma-70 domain-containing protein n=1 Tax=Oceanicoccus sagamiensis TaxID=716816 RepID=A0A1X9NFD3_9GAMM|nr:sigma-70 family RNA polymerase sigma factor [Oceanicoccus sagamiensis]ARN75142.1 hypothetical protein BST96_14065 [Oceanicoccus sagamiensis]